MSDIIDTQSTSTSAKPDDIQAIQPDTSIGKTLSHASSHTWKNLGTMIGVFLTYMLTFAIGMSLLLLSLRGTGFFAGETNTASTPNLFFLLASIIVLIISAFISIAISKGFILTDKDKKVDYVEFFNIDRNVFMGFLTSIVSTFIFSIIPAIIIALIYMAFGGETTALSMALSVFVYIVSIIAAFYMSYAPYYSLEDGTGPFRAIKNSCVDVSRAPLYVLGLTIVMLFITLVGTILIIPILFIYPLSMVATANSYRAISQHRTEEVVRDIDRRFSPTVELINSDAERDMNIVMNERNSQDI